MYKIPKILAPAGSKEALIAAIQNGADEVYIGGQQFGARAFASNFSNEEIKEVVAYAHIRGVAIYVTVNTLVLEEELKEVMSFIDFLYHSDVDGVIVQDIGIVSLIRRHYPDFNIVASTQMNIHNLEGAKLCKELGISRIVVAREMDRELIAKIKAEVDIEIEAFCHGALCVSYSGNCLLSSFIGKRSGNRGKCAQPCRLLYQMEKGGKLMDKPLPLLSTKELMTLQELPALMKAGVDSLKIEGRMKSPEYVALTTRIYKEALQQYAKDPNYVINEATIRELAASFNRDFTKGYINLEKDYNVIHAKSSNHQGVWIGNVTRLNYNKATIALSDSLSIEDGIRIKDDQGEMGFIVNEFYSKNQRVKLASRGDNIEIEVKQPVAVGARVYKTLDSVQNKNLQKTYDKEYRKVELKVYFKAVVGQPFYVEFADGVHTVFHQSSYVVQSAINAPMSAEMIHEKLNKLGNTPFVLGSLSCFDVVGSPMIPIKIINDAKNDLIDQLSALRKVVHQRASRVEVEPQPLTPSLNITPFISVKVHTLSQVKVAIELGVKTIYIDDEVILAQAQKLYPDTSFIFAYPRVVENYRKFDTFLQNNENKNGSVIIAEFGGLTLTNPYKKIDCYLNTINHESLAFYLHYGQQVTFSLESNLDNSEKVLSSFKQVYGFQPNVAHVVYGYMDAMLLKYCPIAYSNNIKVKHCQECRQHDYELVDRLGYRFPFATNRDCTVRLLNSKRTVLFEEVNELLALGISELRLDFTIEKEDETRYVIQAFMNKMKDKNAKASFNNATFGHYYEAV